MTLTLYGPTLSTCTQRVMLVLSELGAEYQLSDVDLRAGEHKAEGYVRDYHPFGRVPVLDDGGLRIFESRAICRYLIAKYGGQQSTGGRAGASLVPTDPSPEAVARFETASSVEYSYFDPTMKSLAFVKLLNKLKGLGDPNPNEVSRLTDQLRTTLDYYEGVLSKRDYLASDQFSVVDLYHMPSIHFLARLDLQEEVSTRPFLKAWWERVSGRSAWKDLMTRI